MVCRTFDNNMKQQSILLYCSIAVVVLTLIVVLTLPASYTLLNIGRVMVVISFLLGTCALAKDFRSQNIRSRILSIIIFSVITLFALNMLMLIRKIVIGYPTRYSGLITTMLGLIMLIGFTMYERKRLR